MVKNILGVNVIIVKKIKLPHVFSPSKNLSDKSFYTRKWSMISKCSFNDLKRGKKSEIDRRREHRMVNSDIILIHRIFQASEINIVIFEKVAKE